MIYSDDFIYIEIEPNALPWIKIFTKSNFKEISHCDENTRKRLFDAALECEKAMIEFYNPTKINWASFANYVPRVHIHIQARFEDDEFFPESLWGKKQRDSVPRDIKIDEFAIYLNNKLNKVFN
ncbi:MULTISPECIES: HIT family protein [Campylobacter]|uniref:HIT domain-containing protein n=1 Tax=Campylobacter porcelli TaxID=1660073 RepID=A0A1X9SX60_9BACT|nr:MULTISPECIES: HIT domain-containing protein [unclassified Campylobacter]MCR8679683.1 HIT domain-containing protein [Campylobacter sp. RM19072]MCR8696843.1 HIT domain-containing protein [Campylobacter sp. RM19073]MEE3704403.1 HIT domain-containing protein [Campylobacter sp. CX2-8023-23]MEE3745144.1 HIT domain-containing protein [Campylobacter sp. CX2-4855-23]MEE3777391.1 HIT domain-containing protein [Campylobacter sp. CX2-4080-23]